MDESKISKASEEELSHIQKITPFLWFDNQAEQAANFYVSIFKNSKIGELLSMERKDMRFMEETREQ